MTKNESDIRRNLPDCKKLVKWTQEWPFMLERTRHEHNTAQPLLECSDTHSGRARDLLRPSCKPLSPSGRNSHASGAQEQLKTDPHKRVTSGCLVPGQWYPNSCAEHEEKQQANPPSSTTTFQQNNRQPQAYATSSLDVQPDTATSGPPRPRPETSYKLPMQCRTFQRY